LIGNAPNPNKFRDAAAAFLPSFRVHSWPVRMMSAFEGRPDMAKGSRHFR
jgi:hypothetical protein